MSITEADFLDTFETCCFCRQKITILSNPQLTTCFHNVCFKCAKDRKSYCWQCQQPVNVIGDNSVLTTVMKSVSGDPIVLSPEESMTDYEADQFGELADKVEDVIEAVKEKLKILDDLKIKMKARAVIEPALALEGMKKQIDESKTRTIREVQLESQRHIRKWDEFVESNKLEKERIEKKFTIARNLNTNREFVLEHSGFIGPLRKSILLTQTRVIPAPLIKFDAKMDLRFGMLMSLSFIDAYKRLSKIIPEEVLEKCYCKRLRIDVINFRPFLNHLKKVDRMIPPPPVIKEKVFIFSDFGNDECVDLVTTLLTLKQKVRCSENDFVTHIIVRKPEASVEIIKVILSGGWMLKSTYVTNAKIINCLPNEYDHEWTTLKMGVKAYNPRACREAIHRRGLPFCQLTIIVCTSNSQDSEILRAGGAETVESPPLMAQNAIDALVRAGKKKSTILIVYNLNDLSVLMNLIKIVKVPLYTLDRIMELTMRGWFDRFNPLFALRHHFRPGS